MENQCVLTETAFVKFYKFLSLAMEDAHVAVLDLDSSGEGNTFFAVYDGHGGMPLCY